VNVNLDIGDEDDFEDLDDLFKKPIGVRDTGKELAAGFPQQCWSDNDCVYIDGTVGRCSCGFDGNFWCEPNWNSKLFDMYWRYDERGFIDYETYTIWSAHYMYYIYMHTGPECMDVLEEISELKDIVRDSHGPDPFGAFLAANVTEVEDKISDSAALTIVAGLGLAVFLG
jgi:hypothetical protein